MLGPSRVLPRVGARARVAHFGGDFERGTIVSVSEDARRVEVLCEGGETLAFVLSPATARFVAAAGTHGPRLELLGD
jgi:phage gp45-like